MYSKEEKAIHTVFLAFSGKKRIKENIDIAFHSISVGYMLKNLGCNEDTVLIGFLHDIIEDTKMSYKDVAKEFGTLVADGVLKVSEKSEITVWRNRKIEFLNRLEAYEENIILVELADKLQNLLSDYHLFIKNGKESLGTLKNTYEDNKWYYLKMQEIFNRKLNKNEMLNRYNKILDIYFND